MLHITLLYTDRLNIIAIFACLLISEYICLRFIFYILAVADNKFRILKNGAIAAILNSMRLFSSDEQLQVNGLKALCNLLESGELSIHHKYRIRHNFRAYTLKRAF